MSYSYDGEDKIDWRELGFTNVEFEDFPSTGVLDAVDTDASAFIENMKLLNPNFACANTFAFRFNGKGYVCVEDPNDGYRSSMDGLFEVAGDSLRNVFPPCNVRVDKVHQRERYEGAMEQCEILEFTDAQTNKVVLRVGTDNSDDYYPSWEAEFMPENMFCNSTDATP